MKNKTLSFQYLGSKKEGEAHKKKTFNVQLRDGLEKEKTTGDAKRSLYEKKIVNPVY